MVAEYVASFKTVLEIARALKTAADSLNDANLKFQVAELVSALADAKIEVAECNERIFELERLLNTQRNMKYDGSVYFQQLDGGDKNGPFCPKCFDVDQKAVRLKHVKGNWAGDWYCQNCAGHFG